MHRRRSPGRLPRPLLLLLASVFLLTTSWALLVPAFQSPDESSHFGYVQTLVEEHEIPGREPGRPFSTEHSSAANASNTPQVRANILAKPVWNELAYERWRRVERTFGPGDRADGGGSSKGGNTARANPPLYYLYAGVTYVAASGSDLFGRFYLMRLWSSLLLLVSVAATWALVGELFGGDRLLQLVGASLVGLQPMASFISASLTPDSMLIAAFALAMWLGVRVLRRGLTAGRGAALCAAAAAAVLTKGTGYALIPGVLLVLAVGLRRARAARAAGAEPRAAPGARAVAIPAAVLLLPIAAWIALAKAGDSPAINELGPGTAQGIPMPGLASYLWQFYLPHLPFQTALTGYYPPLPAYDYWIKGGWASFGYLEVNFPDPVYVLLAAVTVAIVAGGAGALLRARRSVDLAAVAFAALVALCLLAGLHAIDFRNLGQPFMQGRYLLPLLPLLGVCAAGALRLLPANARAGAAGLVLGGLVALQMGSLALVAGRYLA